MSSHEPVGVLVGGGLLPRRVIEALHANGRAVFAIGINGEVSDEIASDMDNWIDIGHLQRARDLMRAAGVREFVCIGGVQRPDLGGMQFDEGGMWFVQRVQKHVARGDDVLLRVLLEYFEQQGFEILSAGDLLPPQRDLNGVLTHATATAHSDDVARAIEVARHIGALDIGQAVVVARGVILAVEGPEGTDAMLSRVAGLSLGIRGSANDKSGVLAKCPKPQQDRRVDLPALGPQTIQGAINAGLAGIVFEPGGVLIEALDTCIELANREGIFLLGLSSEEA